MAYKPHADLDAKAFDILQNMPPEIAQAFFWNYKSREQRRDAILAWHSIKQVVESVKKVAI